MDCAFPNEESFHCAMYFQHQIYQTKNVSQKKIKRLETKGLYLLQNLEMKKTTYDFAT